MNVCASFCLNMVLFTIRSYTVHSANSSSLLELHFPIPYLPKADAWSSRCSYMGSMSVSSCRCCMFVSCVHPVVVLNAAFCMTCSLLMLVGDEGGDHMEEAYSRAGPMTVL